MVEYLVASREVLFKLRPWTRNDGREVLVGTKTMDVRKDGSKEGLLVRREANDDENRR